MAEQKATIARIGNTPLSEIPSLAAWRTVFRSFNVDPTQYRSAPEALLRRLTKKGEIPSINLLVDLCNMVSIRFALPVAIFETRQLQAPLTVRIAEGTERFTTLNETDTEQVVPSEVIFVDEAKLVYARRWCWRQSSGSAATTETTEAIITIEGHHASAVQDVPAALDELLKLLQLYSGGQLISSVLGKDRRAI